MLKLRDGIVELYKKAAISIPQDIEDALKTALSNETNPTVKEYLDNILGKIISCRVSSNLVCEDTGFPIFFVKSPKGLSYQFIKDIIIDATKIATEKIPLNPNAVNTITGENSGNNIGEYFPMIYMEETDKQTLTIDLMLRGGDCENLGQTYNLLQYLNSSHLDGDVFCPVIKKYNGPIKKLDIDKIKECIKDAVSKTKGKRCLPYILGIAIGGSRDQVSFLSKKQLSRRLNEKPSNTFISEIENLILKDVNNYIHKTEKQPNKMTIIGVKIATAHRHPKSLFIDVSFSCWALRRATLVW